MYEPWFLSKNVLVILDSVVIVTSVSVIGTAFEWHEPAEQLAEIIISTSRYVWALISLSGYLG